jgi:hypothetical protein
MEDLQKEQERLARTGNYSKAIDQIQEMIDLLTQTRDSIISNPSTTGIQLAKLKQPVKKSFDKANDNLKEVHSALKDFSKVLDKVFQTDPIETRKRTDEGQKLKNQSLPDTDNDPLSSQTYLINRAIAMHLLREGQFHVATTFVQEASSHPNQSISTHKHAPITPTPSQQHDWEIKSEALQKQFTEMYHILDELRQQHNLDPAIAWARTHTSILESRGSNLEFELCRLQFMCLFLGTDSSDMDMDPSERILQASAYAREAFQPFQNRYGAEIQKLVGAIAYWQNIPDSPYARIFAQDSAWDDVATSFTKEFCSLLGLSADSPLYIATTAGAIALPVLLKVRSIMKEKRTEWTTEEELPVEIPLPPSYSFHSIFVCPVSKEQATDANPPMMMPCGHVICNESLEKVSKGARFKCPYCPGESHPREAKKVFL